MVGFALSMETAVRVRYLVGVRVLELELERLQEVRAGYISFLRRMKGEERFLAVGLKRAVLEVKLDIADLEDCIRRLKGVSLARKGGYLI